MPQPKFKKLCIRCKKYYLPDKSKYSAHGYCTSCRFVYGRCKFLTEFGYQCQNKSEAAGFCMEHFLNMPIKELIKKVK
ncbi:hypothetical protein J4214_03255 [Candidatus Woesearchaeota archaeon]|nr:hypothetical protein [Candidatus Woesearchaeota archaeon]